MQAQRTHNMITMKYSVLVFIALLSAHLVLANKTQHHLREQLRRQAPGTPSRLGKPSDANASAVGKHHQVRRRLPKAKINLEPSTSPSDLPSISPSNLPSHLPTMQPTNPPSAAPSRKPTQPPSPPTQVLSTSSPSSTPTSAPTNKPTLPDCDDYDEVMDKAYTEGDKVRDEVQLYVCMFSSCDWSKLDRSGHWGTPNPAFCVLDNNLTTQQSSSSPSLSSSDQPSSGPTNKPNTLPDCPGSEYSENSEPLFQHGNFTYYSSNGQDYEYYQCISYEDGPCNEGSSPGRPSCVDRLLEHLAGLGSLAMQMHQR